MLRTLTESLDAFWLNEVTDPEWPCELTVNGSSGTCETPWVLVAPGRQGIGRPGMKKVVLDAAP